MRGQLIDPMDHVRHSLEGEDELIDDPIDHASPL
jgi:hypothetical protein